MKDIVNFHTCSENKKVPIGFTEETFFQGIHIGYIYNDEAERNKIVFQFLESGLLNGEKAAYFMDVASIAGMEKHRHALGLDKLSERHRGRITLATTQEIYYPGGTFVPDEILDRLGIFYTQSLDEGFTGVRIIGETSWLARGMPGSSRFMEYEARVNDTFINYPVNAICLYDGSLFDSAMLRDVLAVHPIIVVHGQAVKNPYYIKPWWFLKKYQGLHEE